MSSFSFTPFPELITDRLWLRQLTQEDTEFIYLLRSNKQVNTFIERPLATSEKEALDFIIRINDGISKNKSLYWLIVLKNKKKAVGTVALWQFSSKENSAEIGFELMPQYQGKGIMQEALQKIILYVFEKMDLKKLYAWTHKENKSSIKLLEKNNFKIDNEAEKLNKENNKLENMNIYSLLRVNE